MSTGDSVSDTGDPGSVPASECLLSGKALANLGPIDWGKTCSLGMVRCIEIGALARQGIAAFPQRWHGVTPLARPCFGLARSS